MGGKQLVRKNGGGHKMATLGANEHHDNDSQGSLSKDIQRMLHSEKFCDMVFVCGDEHEEIGACRMLVASRSPMLESMLLHSGMTESRLTRIHLPNIDPLTMRICIEFLYTDAVQDSSWHSIFSAMKVVEAAMFFLLIRLERLAIGYLHRTSFRHQFEDTEWNLGIIAAYNLGLQLYPTHFSKKDRGLVNMRNLLDKFRVYVLDRIGCNTKRLFSQGDQERLIYKNLSEIAFMHAIQRSEKYGLGQPLAEYFTFLHLVRWTALRLVLDDASIKEDELEDVLNNFIPGSLELLSSSKTINIESDTQVHEVMKLLSHYLSQTLRKFPLNFAKIPTDILCRFIEPLRIIPEATLFSAYRMQALNVADLRWDPCGHPKKYVIDIHDSSVISCSREKFKGFARCCTYLTSTKSTFFEWEIVVQTPCENMRIGFYIHRPNSANIPNGELVLGDVGGSWALGADGNLYSANFSEAKHSKAYVDPFYDKEAVVVEVHLDMAYSRCSFKSMVRRQVWHGKI